VIHRHLKAGTGEKKIVTQPLSGKKLKCNVISTFGDAECHLKTIGAKTFGFRYTSV
jgi:hypothetical protein